MGITRLSTKFRSIKQADAPQSNKAWVVLVWPDGREREIVTRNPDTGSEGITNEVKVDWGDGLDEEGMDGRKGALGSYDCENRVPTIAGCKTVGEVEGILLSFGDGGMGRVVIVGAFGALPSRFTRIRTGSPRFPVWKGEWMSWGSGEIEQRGMGRL